MENVESADKNPMFRNENKPKNGTKPHTHIKLYYSTMSQNYNYRNRNKMEKNKHKIKLRIKCK